MKDEQLIALNDRLADVLVSVKGFKAGILANPNGNKEQRKALIEFSEYIEENLIKGKKHVHNLIS